MGDEGVNSSRVGRRSSKLRAGGEEKAPGGFLSAWRCRNPGERASWPVPSPTWPGAGRTKTRPRNGGARGREACGRDPAAVFASRPLSSSAPPGYRLGTRRLPGLPAAHPPKRGTLEEFASEVPPQPPEDLR